MECLDNRLSRFFLVVLESRDADVVERQALAGGIRGDHRDVAPVLRRPVQAPGEAAPFPGVQEEFGQPVGRPGPGGGRAWDLLRARGGGEVFERHGFPALGGLGKHPSTNDMLHMIRLHYQMWILRPEPQLKMAICNDRCKPC